MVQFDVGNCNCEILGNPDPEKKLETQFSLKLFHFSQGRLQINPWKGGSHHHHSEEIMNMQPLTQTDTV